MRLPAQSVEQNAVSPLELFFDLVFVFAVAQLSHYLLDHLSLRGAAEILVMLIAVFGGLCCVGRGAVWAVRLWP
jgi:low temperature requirement protein LtrA